MLSGTTPWRPSLESSISAPGCERHGVIANADRGAYAHRHGEDVAHRVSPEGLLIEAERAADFLHPGLIFRDGPQRAVFEHVGSAVAHAGDSQIVRLGFEGGHDGGSHAFEQRIAGGFGENPLVGFFDSGQQCGGIPMRRPGEDFHH